MAITAVSTTSAAADNQPTARRARRAGCGRARLPFFLAVRSTGWEVGAYGGGGVRTVGGAVGGAVGRPGGGHGGGVEGVTGSISTQAR